MRVVVYARFYIPLPARGSSGALWRTVQRGMGVVPGACLSEFKHFRSYARLFPVLGIVRVESTVLEGVLLLHRLR